MFDDCAALYLHKFTELIQFLLSQLAILEMVIYAWNKVLNIKLFLQKMHHQPKSFCYLWKKPLLALLFLHTVLSITCITCICVAPLDPALWRMWQTQPFTNIEGLSVVILLLIEFLWPILALVLSKHIPTQFDRGTSYCFSTLVMPAYIAEKVEHELAKQSQAYAPLNPSLLV